MSGSSEQYSQDKQKRKRKKPTTSWTNPHFTPARSSTWQLSTQFWVINGWASKSNQIIYVWELDPIKCWNSTATFTLIYSIGHVFCSLWIVYHVGENAALERSWFHSCSCHCIRPLLLLPLPCYSLLEHSYIVRMCTEDVFWYWLQLFSLLYAVTEARTWKIGSTCYPMLVFLFIDSKCTNLLPKQCNKDYKMRIQRQHCA